MFGKIFRYYRYLQYTGLFRFLRRYAIKLLLFLILFWSVLLLLNFIFPIKNIFYQITKGISFKQMYLFFYLSESFLGIFPPDLFIFWIGQHAARIFINPWLLLSFLCLSSYLGGLTAWRLGKAIRNFSFIKKSVLQNYRPLVLKLKKWGGFFIGIAALLPVPFSVVLLLSGIVEYPLQWTAFWAALRPFRFCFDALFIFYFLNP